VNALFYQFDEASITSLDSIGRRVIVGLITSLLVFVPTTMLSLLFRRVQRRSAVFRESTPAEASSNLKLEVRRPGVFALMDGLAVCRLKLCTRTACWWGRLAMQVDLIEESTWYHRAFLEWTVPWWTAPILYAIIAVGWALCIYTTLLYGVKFSDDQVRAAPGAVGQGMPADVLTADCLVAGVDADRSNALGASVAGLVRHLDRPLHPCPAARQGAYGRPALQHPNDGRRGRRLGRRRRYVGDDRHELDWMPGPFAPLCSTGCIERTARTCAAVCAAIT